MNTHDNHDNTHDMLNEYLGFRVLKNLNNDDTYSRRDGMKEQAKITLNR